MPLVRQGFAFILRRFYQYGTYDLYEIALEDWLKHRNEVDHLPRIEDFIFKIISTNQEADELEADGLEFRSHVINVTERLDRGAIAFCVFVERELAHIFWVAMNEEAKDVLGELPYRVDFSKNESTHGDLWTNPKYRGMRLPTYVGFKARQFLWENGKVLLRGPVARGNVAAQRSYANAAPKLYAQGRYLKILWWKSWKEKPLPPSGNGSSGC
jgi:hypothetical protein